MNKQLETAYHSLQEKLSNVNLTTVFEKFYSHAPIFAWRFGLGPIVGRYIMIITQINHKTGNPCKYSMEDLHGLPVL